MSTPASTPPRFVCICSERHTLGDGHVCHRPESTPVVRTTLDIVPTTIRMPEPGQYVLMWEVLQARWAIGSWCPKFQQAAKALQGIQGKLRLIRSTAAVTAGALHQQNCEMDEDAATVLGRLVVDGLTDQMVEVDLLLGEENESVDEEVAS